jgi:hypothetical protein
VAISVGKSYLAQSRRYAAAKSDLCAHRAASDYDDNIDETYFIDKKVARAAALCKSPKKF